VFGFTTRLRHLRRAALVGCLGLLAALPAARPSHAAAPAGLAPRVATFSIVAVDTIEGEWGVAVASRFLAVGSVVPWARAGVGAVATQASANTAFGSYGLDLMERGYSASETLTRLLATDDQPEIRQLALVDGHGRTAVHSGEKCDGWAGAARGPGFAVIGNSLTGGDVVDSMARAFQETRGSLAERLLAALEAGDGAGGDHRGRQAAALLVVKGAGGYRGGDDRMVDLRVDDHEAPVKELERIYVLHAAYYLPAIHVRLGDENLAAGHRAEAEREYARVVDLFGKAIKSFPQDARLMNGLAWFYVQHRANLDEAFRWAEAARRQDPKSWEIVDTLAEIHFARGNFVQAYQHALLALELDPESSYLRGQVARFQDLVERLEQ
jgi:uncharacterized Ntn-hydrolase superfamily protein